MKTTYRCSECGAVVESSFNKETGKITKWKCTNPKCMCERGPAPDVDFDHTIDMKDHVEHKSLAARLVPRAGLLELQPLKVCDTGDEARNIIREEAKKDAAYLYTVVNVTKKRVKA